MKVTARACANIALIKYWGKRPGLLNSPATPSISMTLEALQTETSVETIDKEKNLFFLNGESAPEKTAQRFNKYLEIWKAEGLLKSKFKISSVNSFPTQAGLASSASGFAALATALNAFCNPTKQISELSGMARQGSGSAARSIYGGLVALPPNNNPVALPIMPAKEVPWAMIIAIVQNESKKVGSTSGMNLSAQTSPYYQAWINQGLRDYEEMLKAIKALDFEKMGDLMEANALAMHACMLATRPSLIYWRGTTVEILHEVRKWRNQGLQSYSTIDAGANVILLCMKNDMNRIVEKLKNIPGVNQVIPSYASGDACIIANELS